MKKILALMVAALIGFAATAQYKAPKIVAHRGFHKSEGAARNSLNALKAAQEAGIGARSATFSSRRMVKFS